MIIHICTKDGVTIHQAETFGLTGVKAGAGILTAKGLLRQDLKDGDVVTVFADNGVQVSTTTISSPRSRAVARLIQVAERLLIPDRHELELRAQGHLIQHAPNAIMDLILTEMAKHNITLEEIL